MASLRSNKLGLGYRVTVARADLMGLRIHSQIALIN